MKLLEGNIDNKLLDIGRGNDIFRSDTKSKNKQLGLYQAKKDSTWQRKPSK